MDLKVLHALKEISRLFNNHSKLLKDVWTEHSQILKKLMESSLEDTLKKLYPSEKMKFNLENYFYQLNEK
jgi:hypothetical protein